MPRRANSATPNVALYNLRDARGASQQDVAAALNNIAMMRGRGASVTANQVSRWERGITRTSPFYRQLLSEYYGVSVEELGLSKPKNDPVASVEPAAGFPATQQPKVDPAVAANQEQWRTTRRFLNINRVGLAHKVASLYEADLQLPGTGLIIHPDWIPDNPVPLASIQIEHDDTASSLAVRGTEDFTMHVRPLAAHDRRFHRYSQAIRIIDHPRLFENRLAWCLQDLSWSNGDGHMSFGDTTYFEIVDLCEVFAHEAAAALMRPDGSLDTPTWRGLAARSKIGDPFDLSQRAVGSSTDTLTIRQDRDGSTFVLHDRDAGNVAVAGGMLHVMPCGVFQPSSIKPAARAADFNLWRNIMREYSEEFLGTPEHDGDGEPIDYGAEPFGPLDSAVAAGSVRAYCLGVGLDALTLYGEILTVVVFDADVFDSVFARMVDANDEGTLVKTGSVHPTPAIPFTEHTIRELNGSGRMAPAGAACLQLAWDHRRTILDN